MQWLKRHWPKAVMVFQFVAGLFVWRGWKSWRERSERITAEHQVALNEHLARKARESEIQKVVHCNYVMPQVHWPGTVFAC